MKILLTIFLTALLACSVQKNTGLSYRSAIVVTNPDPYQALLEQYAYIDAHYPGFKIIGRMIRPEGHGHYDIFILRNDHQQVLLYFDITKYREILLNK